MPVFVLVFFTLRCDTKVDTREYFPFPSQKIVSQKMDSLLNETDLPGLVAIAVNYAGERFFIDRKSGVAASIYTQYLPFNHPATTSAFEQFSILIY